MDDTDINLCQITIDEMKKLGFKESSILHIKNNEYFKYAYNIHYSFQRAILSTIFFRILMYSNIKIPNQIRLALNIASDSTGWLDDLRLVILPFLKENEDLFFPVIN